LEVMAIFPFPTFSLHQNPADCLTLSSKNKKRKRENLVKKDYLSDKFNVVYFLCLLAGYPRRVVIRLTVKRDKRFGEKTKS
jgi:hypothetical protein